MPKPRVNGPYKHGRKWRLQFTRGSGDSRETSYETFATKAAAEAGLDAALDLAQGVTVKSAMEQYLAECRARGLAGTTLSNYEDRLQCMFAPVMSRPIRAVMARAAELYAATWQGRAADTHRHGLKVARLWGRWCVKRGLLRSNPFSEVEMVGRPVVGADKERLTVDESRTLEAWCLAHPTDQASVLTLGYLYLGSRASELVRLDVRDLDDNGNLVWIRRTKSEAGRRRLSVPESLRVLLLGLASDKASGAALFVLADGERWSRYVARRRVLAVCADAGVPVLPPQALRRTQATLATEAGETALAVARHLGHATGAAPAVTGRSYVGREATAEAKQRLGLEVLRGGKR